jgi:phosphohistidine phosphatase
MAAIIELYFVRHGIAAERGPAFPDDTLRPLTRSGERRFKEAVAGLRALNIVVDLVLTSPLARARSTALLLADGLTRKPSVQDLQALAPGGPASAVAEAVKKHANAYPRIALVGHEPDLGELAARWLGARGGIEFKKGAVCAIDVDGATPGGPGTLRWLLPPRALRALAP